MPDTATTESLDARVDRVIDDVRAGLLGEQDADGHWAYPLEADCTIPAEYILYRHFRDDIGGDYPELEQKIARFLRRTQEDHGGWALFYNGDLDISATVKAYFALKMAGDDIDAPHMKRAREAVLAAGGAEKANVFTRIMFCLFGQAPWRAAPAMPVEIMLLPRWFIFHMGKVSYWSRTVVVPLLVLMALRPQAKNPKGIGIQELFVTPPEQVKTWHTNPTGTWLGGAFLRLDKLLRWVEPKLSKKRRKRAIKRCMEFVELRLNGEDGLGGIFPAMVNAVLAMEALSYPEDERLITARKAVDKLLVVGEEEAWCQPCLSPIWDTCLMGHAMLNAGLARDDPALKRAADWLLEREITDVKGDWSWKAPDLAPGGWAFEYWNDYYPDVDDSAVIGMMLDRMGDEAYEPALKRTEDWIIGMQSKNGGWGAFDIDNNANWLNSIPFADHGALLDPPEVDVSARCLSFLSQRGYDRDHPTVARGIAFLKQEQEEDGSWFGRWGTNYIYGTWSALSALNMLNEDMDQPWVRKAVDWLKAGQRPDGGWGEDGATYWQERRGEVKESTASQTAWAVLGLMAGGDVDSPEVAAGIRFLTEAEREGSGWKEPWFTAVGFPRVFYLRYHGYSKFFPLWALGRYRALKTANDPRPAWGM